MKTLLDKYEPLLKILIAVLLVFFIFYPDGKESEQIGRSINLENIEEAYDIRNDVMILKDPESNFEIGDISQAPGSWGFMPVDLKKLGSDFGASVFWLEFTVQNTTGSRERLLVLPRSSIRTATLYTPAATGGFLADHFEEADPVERTGFSPKDIVFNLRTPDLETGTFYMKLESDKAVQFSLTIWDEFSYRKTYETNLVLTGIFIGASLLLILYYIHRYTERKNKIHLHFLFFALIILLLAGLMTDYTILNVFPSLIFADENIMLLVLGAANILGCLYLSSFLEKTAVDKVIKKYLSSILFIALATMAVQLVSFWIAAVSLFTLTAANLIYSILLILKSRRINKKYMKVQVGSFVIFFASLILFGLAESNVIPYYGFFEAAILYTMTAGIYLSSLALHIKDKTLAEEQMVRENKAVQRLQLELESVKKADADKDEWMKVTAHGLRTPLYGMIGLAEGLMEESRLRLFPHQAKQMEAIIDYGKKMARQINDLTDISYIKQNELDIYAESVGIHQLVEEVIEICRPLLKNQDIRLYSTLTKSLPNVVADPYRIQQILYNLVDNAIRYTQNGEIVISAKKAGDELAVSVRDTGSGIDRNELQTIFESGKRGEESDTGIGLDISKRLIELHGGWLRAESQKGRGSTFTFSLPIFQDEKKGDLSSAFPTIEEIGEEEFRKSLGMNIRSNKKVKVLVAEKEPLDRNILIQQLQKHNFEVVGTDSGREAFELLEDQRIDLVVLDWTLEDMGGKELCRKIREQYVMTELPILMLSTRTGLQEKMDAFTAGANDYLVKPCDREEFLLRVETLSNLKALTEEITDMNYVLERSVKEKTMALEITNMNLVTVNDEIQEIEKSRNEMLSSISHELGTPITLIHSYIQAVQESLIDEKNPRYLEMIHKKLLLLERLTEDLVELGKYKTGNMTLRFENITFQTWFKKIIAGFESDIRQSGRLFEYSDLEVSPLEIERFLITVDEDRIDQVFSNILWNAVKNTSSTDGKIAVSVQICPLAVEAGSMEENQADAEVVFRISDTGNGIPAEVLPHIFDRFFKLENNSGKKGSGLGLAIAKEIVLSHKGRIWAESEVGVGSSFFIALPLYTIKQEEDVK